MIDKREFRNTLGRFATGVTIVTAVEEGNVHGMTANAFMSVSLEPPLVLVSIDHKAKMHQILPKTRVYGISILREDQEAVSQHFAGRPMEHTPPSSGRKTCRLWNIPSPSWPVRLSISIRKATTPCTLEE